MRVFLLCTGLGHVRRGYESFTQECFAALADVPELNITLFQGGKTNLANATTLWNLPRNHTFAKQLAARFGKSYTLIDPYFIEQISFCLSLIPHLYKGRPDVVFFSDFALGTMLWHWRRISKLSYKLLFSNGAPNGPPFSRMDHVQHLTLMHHQTALEAGEPASKHSLVPYGIQMNQEYENLSQIERNALRRKLDLPINRPIALSVAAINKSHKRIDYLIREVASLPEPRPYLLLLGQIEEESQEILELGNKLLGSENFQAKTVAASAIADFYRVSDLFVLASLNEGFGRVLLEAMVYGLPCLVHDYEITRFVLKSQGYFSDFTACGSLSTLVKEVLSHSNDEEKFQRHKFIYERFSWDRLRPDYVEMLHICANSRTKTHVDL